MPLIGLSNIHRPAPKTFRIIKKLLSNTINFVIAAMILFGYASDSLILLIIKLAQSFIMDQLDTLMGNGEVYAKPDTLEVKATVTTTDTTKD